MSENTISEKFRQNLVENVYSLDEAIGRTDILKHGYMVKTYQLPLSLTKLYDTDLCLCQFFSLRADFFEDSGVKIHGSDPHTH